MIRLSALFLALALVGCSTSGGTSNLAADLAVKMATVQVIESASNPAEKARRVVSVAEAALAYASGDAVLLDVVVDALVAQIDVDSMSPQEAILTQELVQVVSEQIRGKLSNGMLDGSSLTSVQQVLANVVDAARLYE